MYMLKNLRFGAVLEDSAVEGGGEGAVWWEGHGVWATRLCIVTPLLGTWAP